MPDTIDMPVIIYDHLNDGLLFEYPLDGGAANGQIGEDLSMFTSMWGTKNEDGSMGKREFKLIENELGPDKTPVYTQKTVEKVAEIVKNLMDSGYDGGKKDTEGNAISNEIYKDLYEQITGYELGTTGEPIEILPDQGAFTASVAPGRALSYEEMGWTLKDKDGNPTDEKGEIWSKGGDHLYGKQTGATAEITFGELEEGEYYLQYYALKDMNAVLAYGENRGNLQEETGMYWGENGEKVSFTLDEKTEVKISFEAKTEAAEFCNGILASADGTILRNNFTDYETEQKESPTLSGYGITTSNDEGIWGVGEYGVTTGNNYRENAGEIYIEQEVTGGISYELACHNERCRIIVSAGEERLGELNSQNESGKIKFTVPEDIEKIKITVVQDDKIEGEGYRLVREMYLTPAPSAKLGNYGESKEKYNNSSNGLSQIETCMDYAYYMLNNFWTDTSDVTKKAECYTTLTLKGDGSGYYSIDQNNLVYDLENGNIYKDTEKSDNSGFFPLDKALLGDSSASYSFDGDGEIPFDGVPHNYHFATKAHTQFIYKKGLKFTFTGDDDVYLFIDNKKALDLGGAHASETETIELDELAEELGLEEGKVYDMDFFHLERHSLASNFAITTNISYEEPEISCVSEFTDSNGNILRAGDTVQLNSEIGIRYKVTVKSMGSTTEPGMKPVSFFDDKLGFKISKEEGVILPDDIFVKNALAVEVKDNSGQSKGRAEIQASDLEDEKKVTEFIHALLDLTVGNGETIYISGLYKNIEKAGLESSFRAVLDVNINVYQGKTGEFQSEPVNADAAVFFKILPENVVDPAGPTSQPGPARSGKSSRSSKSSGNPEEAGSPASGGHAVAAGAAATGDSTDMGLYMVLLGFALGGILAIIKHMSGSK